MKDIDGRWKWDGKVTSLINNALWGEGRPNNLRGNEDCLNSFSTLDYKFDDTNCSRNLNFICEASPYFKI